jgi:predicted adenylyl cyclase CyaB
MSARKLEKYLTRQLERRVLKDSVEREQKYRVEDIIPLRRRLRKLGAEARHSGFERNELFDLNGRLRKLGHKLRLRRHGDKVAMLTLKGPRLASRHKTRVEVETPVHYEQTKRILELVGFRVKETYSKIREEYHLDGCAVCLDHVPGTGWFIEIEGAPGRIQSIARRLRLQREDMEQRSYRRLIRDTETIIAPSTRGRINSLRV